jgi:hypothetical protein
VSQVAAANAKVKLSQVYLAQPKPLTPFGALLAGIHGTFGAPTPGFEYTSGDDIIQLKADHIAGKALPPAEPRIPFRTVCGPLFHDQGNWDYLFLSQSPAYTPRTSDALIEVILSYAELDWGSIDGWAASE